MAKKQSVLFNPQKFLYIEQPCGERHPQGGRPLEGPKG